MRKLSLLATVLAALLLSACATVSPVVDARADDGVVVTATPSPTTTATPEPADNDVTETEAIKDTTAVETTDDWLADLFDTLKEISPPPSYGGSDDCNPWFSNCLYDPFYGSCHWDYWRGIYVCDGYHYRPGYDCSYDWWWGEYTCRKQDSNGWGWGW